MFRLLSIQEFEQLVAAGAVDVLLDTRPENELQDGFIPGAVHMAWEEWNEAAPEGAPSDLHQPGYLGKLADPIASQVPERLTALGISNKSHVVVYANGARSKGREGRIAWMLLYFGVENVSILNGGWRAWTRSSRLPFSGKRGKEAFALRPDERRRAHFPAVRKQHLENGGATLIDTRGTREFAGELYQYQPRLGHIPGAQNMPYRHLLRSTGEFIDRDSYLRLLQNNTISRESIFYCEVGVRAAMAALLHEIYTGEVLPVYDASFMEWSLDLSLPVEYNARDADEVLA
jgi:thiosulfate/3-mercaptopyruvate sulfurtransferase